MKNIRVENIVDSKESVEIIHSKELLNSVKELSGLVTPMIVRRTSETSYVVVHGNLQLIREARLSHINVIVLEDYDFGSMRFPASSETLEAIQCQMGVPSDSTQLLNAKVDYEVEQLAAENGKLKLESEAKADRIAGLILLSKKLEDEIAFLEKTIKKAGIDPLKIPTEVPEEAPPVHDHHAEKRIVKGIAQLRKDAEYSKIVEFCQAEKGTYVEIARKVLNGFHVGREFKGQIAPLSSLTIGAICRKKTFNSDVIVRELNSLNSIEEGKKYLTKSCKCKDEYEKVAMYLGIISSSGTFSSKTICKLKNSILEMTIGYRIRAAAIQG